MSTFFTADLHLGHVRINEFQGRPFSDVERADEFLIQNWNSVVQQRDTTFILGDLAMGDIERSLRKVARLNGTKYLVPGNHDRVSSVYRGSPERKDAWEQMYLDAGLKIAPEIADLSLFGERATLSHFPFVCSDGRYAELHPKDRSQFLLHGHVHSEWKFNGRQINVGVDVWDYCPVPIHAIRDYFLAVRADEKAAMS